MLAKTLLRIAALHVMKAARVASIVPAEDAAFGIDLHAERIAAPFGEDLVFAHSGMIAPDELPERMRDFLFARPANVSRYGAALPRVEPAIGSPAKAVRD